MECEMSLGIDFGSTYSTVSSYNSKTGRAEAISLESGKPVSIPSVVSLVGRNEMPAYGEAAKDKIGNPGTRTFEAFKMLLVENDPEILREHGYDKAHTPRWAAEAFLKYLVNGAMERRKKSPEEELTLKNVTICVPEIWCGTIQTQAGRGILRDILKNKLGLATAPAVRVVTEPEAASAFFAYNYNQETKKLFNGHLLLIDYGGGTLDITLTEVKSPAEGKMQITYCEGGGAGENHSGTIGTAGIAYMQQVVELAMRENGLLKENERPNYAEPAFRKAVKELEGQLKSSEGMRGIKDEFDSYGAGYEKCKKILKDEAAVFFPIYYKDIELEITYQQLFRAYQNVIEPVLKEQLRDINDRVRKHIQVDPCQPEVGNKDNFKIAVVGGYGSFYLVQKQIHDIYHLDNDPSLDKRTRGMDADEREQAISLGAALLAAGKVDLQQVARQSIGLCTQSAASGLYRIHYAIHAHKVINPNKTYYLCENGRPLSYGCLRPEYLEWMMTEYEGRDNHGYPIRLRQNIRERFSGIPRSSIWHIGFSVDENGIISFHLDSTNGKETFPAIELASFQEMFEGLQEVNEIEIPEGGLPEEAYRKLLERA